MSSPEPPTRVHRITGRLQNNPVLAVIIVVGIAVIAIGHFTDAIVHIRQFLNRDTPSAGTAEPPNVTVSFDPASAVLLEGDAVEISATIRDEADKVLNIPIEWKLVDEQNAAYVSLLQEGNKVRITRKLQVNTALASSEELIIPLMVITSQQVIMLNNIAQVIVRRGQNSTRSFNNGFHSAFDEMQNALPLFAYFEQIVFREPLPFSTASLSQRTEAKKSPSVFIMDNRFRVYNPKADQNRASNATDIDQILHELSINSTVETVDPDWKREVQVIEKHPDLIIIHYHCFSFTRADNRGNWDAALQSFIAKIVKALPKIQFLIYSRDASIIDREPDGQGRYLLPLRYEQSLKIKNLRDHIHPFHVRPTHNSFCDQSTRLKLIEEVRTILQLKKQ